MTHSQNDWWCGLAGSADGPGGSLIGLVSDASPKRCPSLTVLLRINRRVLDVRAPPRVSDLQRSRRGFDHRGVGVFTLFGFQVLDLLPHLPVIGRARQT